MRYRTEHRLRPGDCGRDARKLPVPPSARGRVLTCGVVPTFADTKFSIGGFREILGTAIRLVTDTGGYMKSCVRPSGVLRLKTFGESNATLGRRPLPTSRPIESRQSELRLSVCGARTGLPQPANGVGRDMLRSHHSRARDRSCPAPLAAATESRVSRRVVNAVISGRLDQLYQWLLGPNFRHCA